MKKIFYKSLILFFLLLLIPSIICADDETFEENISFENLSILTSSNQSDEPTLNARHAVIFDRNSKTAIYGKHEKEKCKMASTTKIMTAIIVIENSNRLHDERAVTFLEECLEAVVCISRSPCDGMSASVERHRIGINDKGTIVGNSVHDKVGGSMVNHAFSVQPEPVRMNSVFIVQSIRTDVQIGGVESADNFVAGTLESARSDQARRECGRRKLVEGVVCRVASTPAVNV